MTCAIVIGELSLSDLTIIFSISLALLISAARHLLCTEYFCRITGIWDVDIDGPAREHFGLETKAYDTLRVTQRGRAPHVCVKNLKL